VCVCVCERENPAIAGAQTQQVQDPNRLATTDKTETNKPKDGENQQSEQQAPSRRVGCLCGGCARDAVGAVPLSDLVRKNSALLQRDGSRNTDFLDPVRNAAAVKERRARLTQQCQSARTIHDIEAVGKASLQGFQLPLGAAPPQQPRDPNNGGAVVQCRNVVMDFGANVGDTSGHVVDAGNAACARPDIHKDAFTAEVHYNIESKQFEHVAKRNMLTKNLEMLMQLQQEGGSDISSGTSSSTSGPEDYCYYGIEGNPHFTERLRKIEDSVMAIRPRPIQHMHFFTESVGAGADGMTKLYLDTVNTKQNFWGSSIFKDHQDVRRSGGGDAETVASPVMGYTIPTLMRKTLSAFDSTGKLLPASSSNGKSHLILKVDIEGGEYPLLHQAVQDGTLCEFCRAGHTADLFIEFHSQRVTGKHDYVGKTKQMKDTLTACGVTFRNLAAWWA
jgi:Methyltransferase FkbM domain